MIFLTGGSSPVKESPEHLHDCDDDGDDDDDDDDDDELGWRR